MISTSVRTAARSVASGKTRHNISLILSGMFYSKDKRAIVWDVKKGKKHAELGWDCPNNVKYLYKRVKFGCVEGDIKKYKVYTISNPIGSSKAPSFLHRWNTQSYTVEQAVST